ncbi:60S ribosomal protein L21-1-like [Dendrobium catenatum]|uniref:60S ribosomal protein L21-1-like n=1 Tax=Dendrobium catenatum TaxID=906689 RepID=UPI0010A045BD|nr:60S ribosomal protein L21-1-like [Dendrobium catenatum]
MKGYVPLTTYLWTYKFGEYVDVKVANITIKKRIHVLVEHVQPSRCAEEFRLRKKKNNELKEKAKALGEIISTKRQPEGPKPGFIVGSRTIKKGIHVRVEHVQPSRCAEEFRLRKKKNNELKEKAKALGEIISTKRQPEGPKPGFIVCNFRDSLTNSI